MDLFLHNLSSDSLDWNIIRLPIYNIHMEVRSGAPFMYLLYGGCGGLATKCWIASLLEVCITKRRDTNYKSITNTTNTKGGIQIHYGVDYQYRALQPKRTYVNHFYLIWYMVYSLPYITKEFRVRLKTDYFNSTSTPLKISLEFPVTRLVVKYKSLWK